MPETKAVERIVLRKDPLTEDEWRELVHERRESMGLVLNQVTLPDLWSVEFTQSDFKTPLTLGHFRGDIPNGSKLEMQGVYMSRALKGGRYVIWGLARNQHWIACTLQEGSRYHSRYIEEISVRWANDPKFLLEHGIRYYDMLRLMSNALSGWIERRRRQLQTLEGLDERMRHENDLIQLLNAH